MEKKKLNELNEFMEQYSDEYDLSDIALLPKELVSIGEVKVLNNTDLKYSNYIFILDDFNISMISARDKSEKDPPNQQAKMSFKFALFLPKSIIQTKIDKVKD